MKDNAGNESAPGSLTVQVDATPPTLEIKCPAMVAIGSSANATVTASDAYSGLKTDPCGTVPINTSKAGDQTITRTAISNVGLETMKSCTTVVGYYVIVTGRVDSLTVKSGEAVELTSTATVSGKTTVKAGGALDIEGATLERSLIATRAALLRVCGASIGGRVKVSGSSGSVVIGEGTSECAASTISQTTIKANTGGVEIDGNAFGSSLSVLNNGGGTTVINNKVAASLSVNGNTGSVVDKPNEVGGKSKLQ